MSTSDRAYHHGDLREALLKAAEALLKEQPMDKIGLREVARRVGVSSAAPYRHFASRDELLALVAARGFTTLAQQLDEVLSQHGPDALEELGEVYVRFAVRRPHLFALMLRGIPPAERPEALQAAARKAFQILQTAADAASGEPNRAGAIGAWALVHGLSMLLVERQLAPDLANDEGARQLVRSATRTYAKGLRERK